MPLKTRFRLTELLFAVAVVAAALVWAERTAWRQISSLRAEMTTDQIARFRSADTLRATILELHNWWRRSIAETNTTSRIELESAGRKVKEMIEAQTKKTGSPGEAQLSKEITIAFADYLSRVSKSLDTPPVTPESAASRAAEQEVETALERLLALSEKLTADTRLVDAVLVKVKVTADEIANLKHQLLVDHLTAVQSAMSALDSCL